MAASSSPPEPQWLVQEPEGPLAPKTPGRWRAVWASDNVRLEEAHRAGVDEVLVCGRKYMVDMKGRRIRALYWREEPEWRPVIRATYFLRQGNGWLPYTEEDAQAVEDYQSCSRGGVRDGTCVEAGIALADGRNKVLVRRKMLPEGATQGPEAEERKSRGSTELELEYIQKPLKAQNILQSFGLNTREVHRGAPEPGSWGGVSCSEEDHPQEASLPEHLVFVVHGIGESMWSKASTSVVSFRSSCQDMRNLSLQLREAQRLQREDSKRADTAAGEETSPRGMEEDVRHVEFLPVEWYELLHGEDKEAERIMQDITLPSISAFREFAGQAIMDVMYYLTPDIQKAILTTVVSEMNRMWAVFKETNPTFTGKVSIMGHSLGSIITHDVLSAQPLGKIQTGSFAHELQVPILQFEPEVFLACGSPIGMFLVLRSGSLDRQKLLKFETTKRFYNVFHSLDGIQPAAVEPGGPGRGYAPADPVAYRLEPVLDHRLRNLEPERVPHIGGDRMHIKVQKINRTVTRAVSRFAKTADENLQMLSKSWVNTLKAVKGELPLLENSRAATGDAIAEAEALLPERIDWALQETAFEGTQPWAAAIFAHGCYFQNIDVMMFLVNAMETPEP